MIINDIVLNPLVVEKELIKLHRWKFRAKEVCFANLLLNAVGTHRFRPLYVNVVMQGQEALEDKNAKIEKSSTT